MEKVIANPFLPLMRGDLMVFVTLLVFLPGADHLYAVTPQSPETIDPSATEVELPPVESVDAATRSLWLIDGVVLDSKTAAPIKGFTVTPGSLSTDDQGKSTIRWRDNLKREMKDGRLRWPRTSGFSVMRFRVTAPGFVPAVTQRIWRGGPHTRMKVQLKSVGENNSLE